MKLAELIRIAGNGQKQTYVHDLNELVADINGAIGAARCMAIKSGTHPYRDGFRAGWGGAINKMRELLETRHHGCAETEAMSKLIDEMSGANDVPEPRELHLPSLTEYATHEKRLRDLEVLCGKLIEKLEARLNEVANRTHDHRGTILHDIDGTLIAFRELIEEQNARIADIEALERIGGSEKRIYRRVEQLESQVSSIHNGVTGPAQLVPEIMKRLDALERWRGSLAQIANQY